MGPIEFTRSVRSLNRLRHIAQALTREGFGHVVSQINLTRFVPVWMLRKTASRKDSPGTAADIGRRLSVVFTELGPTFIKLGQLLTTHPDLLPEELLDEFRSLQDRVPPFGTDEAMKIIEEDLDRPVSEVFESIEPEPLASASIGQVYRAKTPEGRDVVIKVRRPGIEDDIFHDMHILKWIAQSLEEFVPEARVYRPTGIVAELEEMLARELDYINEASTTSRVAEAFTEDFGVLIPKIDWSRTSPRLLTMEALPGRNVDTLLRSGASLNRKMVAKRLADCYLKQIFEVGTFHADPHPGNILVDPPATVGLIDFGQVGTLTEELMTDVISLVYAALQRETQMMVDTLTDMNALGPSTDKRQLQRSLRILLDKYYGLPLKRLDVATMMNELTELLRKNDVFVPRDLSMLIKALGTMGAVTRTLDPDLDLLELLQPRIKKAIRKRFSGEQMKKSTARVGWELFSLLRAAPRQLGSMMRKASRDGWELHVRHENIDKLIRELDRSSNRLSFAVVIAAIIVGSSVVISAGSEAMVFGIPVQTFGILGYLIAGVFGLGLSWAIFRSGRLH